jgi:glucosamine 6-phosphate synthetase-like amidotransferase/phosphosugar isomerase protein
MCGIITIINHRDKKPINQIAIDLYENQYSRGQQGFGMLYLNETNEVKISRACEPVKAFLDLKENKSNIIMFHHRTPTSSSNKLEQTHPLLVENKDLKYNYYVIHNGIINNEDEMKIKHEESGYYYKTTYKDNFGEKFNDSESLAIDLAMYIEKKKDKIETTGSVAFVVAQINKKTKKIKEIFYGHNSGSPLTFSNNGGVLSIASEGLKQEVKEDIMYKWNINNKKLTKQKIEINTFKQTTFNQTGITRYNDDYYDQYNGNYNTGFNDKEVEKILNLDTTTKTDEHDNFRGYEDSDYPEIINERIEEIWTDFETQIDYEMTDLLQEISDPTLCEEAEIETRISLITDLIRNLILDSREQYNLELNDNEPALQQQVQKEIDFKRKEAIYNT